MGDNIKDALAYAVDLSQPVTYEINGETFSRHTLQRIEERQDDIVKPLVVTTLTGFIDYITENRDRLDFSGHLIQITDVDRVRIISVPNKDKAREVYIEAGAVLPSIPYGKFVSLEDFNILLQAAFEPTEDRDKLLKYVSHIKIDEGVEASDDGVSQRVVAKTGVASVGAVTLPNPVTLKPYRTFQEVEQVESAFVFRLDKNGNCALFEADGGVWKIRCRERVKEYLRQKFDEILTQSDVVIIG